MKEKLGKITAEECDAIRGDFENGRCIVDRDGDQRFDDTFNSLNSGVVQEEPAGVMRVMGSKDTFAVDAISKSHLERVLSMTKGLTMSEETDYIAKNKPKIAVYTVGEDGEAEKKVMKSFMTTAWSEHGRLDGKIYK